MQDADGPLGPHDGNLRGRPGQIDVGAEGLGPHHDVGAAVGLAGDDGQQRHGGLSVGINEFGAAADNAVVLLLDAGQETRGVDEGEHRNVKRVAGAYEPGGLLRCVDVEGAGIDHRLVGDDADRTTFNASESADDVGGEKFVDLQEGVFVQHGRNDLVHVIGLM